jgi:hypothetical protein
MLVDPIVIYRGLFAQLAVTGGWVKPSGINSILYGPQKVIGGCVGPWISNRGLCDHWGSNRKLCGPHRQQMYALWIPVAVIQVWVSPISSYMMPCGPHAVTGCCQNAVKRNKITATWRIFLLFQAERWLICLWSGAVQTVSFSITEHLSRSYFGERQKNYFAKCW